VLWASGSVLADRMWTHAIEGKRILEVGCGIGLASLVLNRRHADITATDRHPEARGFLAENVRLNRGRPIPFVRVGWTDPASDLGTFDLIIGSDVLYERAHVNDLSSFIDQHAKPVCEVVIVDPGRGEHARFSTRMKRFGYTLTQRAHQAPDSLDRPFDGQILSYRRGFRSPDAGPVQRPL
jgi:predicted nicotinamide N-methyase